MYCENPVFEYSPSLGISMPHSACMRTASATWRARSARSASEKGCPSSLRWRMSTISRGRTRLPTWVVRIRLWLRFIVLTPSAVVSKNADGGTLGRQVARVKARGPLKRVPIGGMTASSVELSSAPRVNGGRPKMLRAIDADTHIFESPSVWYFLDPAMYPRRPIVLSGPRDTVYRRGSFWLIDGNIFPRSAGKGGFLLGTPTEPGQL